MSTTAARELPAFDIPGVRFGAAPAEPVRRLPSGIAPLDALLGGGLPRGHLSEIVGGASSGRTALLHAWLAAATRAGEATAVIDLPDGLDPPSLARAGADLERVLWVRPPTPRLALRCAELVVEAGGFGLVALELECGRKAEERKAEGWRKVESAKSDPGKHFPLSAFRHPSAFRFPPSAWIRLAQMTRRGSAAVMILVPRRVTPSCAALALELKQQRVCWDRRLFEGFSTRVALTRSRFGAADRALTLTIGEQRSAWKRKFTTDYTDYTD